MAFQVELPGLELRTDQEIIDILPKIGASKGIFPPGNGWRYKCDIPDKEDRNQFCWCLSSEVTRALFDSYEAKSKQKQYTIQRLKYLAHIREIEIKYIGNIPRFRTKL